MKNLIILLACALLLQTGCKNGNKDIQLSTLTIEPVLYACATTISVQGFVPGAKIDIYANITTHLGGSISDSPWGQVFSVSPALVAGDSITATQTFAGATSAHSKPLHVIHYPKDDPLGLTKPALDEPIYDCGGAIGVGNLVRGGLLKVYADGVEVGRVDGCGEGQWLSVSPIFSDGQEISADEQLCTQKSPMSDTVRVIPAPDSLPQLTVGDIYENGKYTTLHNITHGALVRVFNGSTMIQERHYPGGGGGGGQTIRLTPQVLPGDTITAEQQLCSTVSIPSGPSIVKPCNELPPPTLGPICPGDDFVKIVNGVLGARIRVYRDSVLAADGGGPKVNLFAPAKIGENYWATQSLNNCMSPKSVALAVGCDLPEIMKPRIPNAGRAVSASVKPSDDNHIMVASETGGLFRSKDKGNNWTHVSGSTTFRYSDIHYLNFNQGTIIASAKKDTRTQSGGGIWRSTDGGSIWTRVHITTPVAGCVDNISGYGVSVDETKKRVWAGTSCGLAFSDDAGLTWSFLPAAPGYNNDETFAVETPDSNRIIIITRAGLEVSDNGGASFSNPMAGIPNRRWGGSHNQIAIAPNDPDHIYWAFSYIPNGDTLPYRGLYQSPDFGTTWNAIIADQADNNRPPFVRTSYSMNGGTRTYDIYWGDGACALRRSVADTGSVASVSAWTSLAFDHCDPSDICFENDGATPLLLLSDGGLHKTKDIGQNWNMAGGGPYGYNALQITEVTGQLHQSDGDVDLYFATQDNDVWASPDKGSTWPAHICCEGFFLNIMRDYYPPDQTRLTGVTCGACGNFISKPILAGSGNFSNPPDDQGNPRLLKPKYYIQNTLPKDSSGSFFMLTKDNGSNWDFKYKYSENVEALSQISGPINSPVIFTAYKTDSILPGGQSMINIKKITGALGVGTPIVSDITGFGSLGIFPTMFAWYKPYGVDPDDANFIIAPDISDKLVKLTTDGGTTWRPDSALSKLVTANGEFAFSWDRFVQLSAIGFNPDCDDHILVGTQQAGIFTSYNNGATWGKIPGSELIPYVSSFFFTGPGEAIVSSYGRGLWKVSFPCQAAQFELQQFQNRITEPLVYYEGVKIPLSSIRDPASMIDFGYYQVRGGQVLDYTINDESQEVSEVMISKGEIVGFTWNGEALDLPFNVSIGDSRGTFSAQEKLIAELNDHVQVKGLLLERSIFKGAILAEKDVSTDQLPQPAPLGPYITIENRVSGSTVVEGLDKIRISGRNFNPNYPVEIFLNGDLVNLQTTPEIDGSGAFRVEIPQMVDMGGHVILVRQQTENGVLQDAATFLKRVRDNR